MLAEKNTSIDKQTEGNQWFEDMVSNLRVDQLLMQTDVLEKHKREVYEAMISGNDDFMHDYARKSSSAFFIKNLIDTYFIELSERKARPNRMALELSNSRILLWAEIADNDDLTENALILSAAKVNFEFAKYGFHISSTIVEIDDKLEVPKHYKEVTIK